MRYVAHHPDLFGGDRKKILELYSAASSLSDMEIFVFPDLLYSLVLAEIMSPRLWAWRDDPWFDGILEQPEAKRLQRLKQYIMDHYTFNLDLDTWGLTTKERELARFSPFIPVAELEKSNALFGYEGDKYYFSMDIRRHFGLDKYAGNMIPYWKTETLEAMDAFRYKDGWETGGGECVSLAVLYAAAMFVVARIPLEQIFLLATPLHSQNFVDTGGGILTNNRRLVTKAMFFNGTELSNKARRALENEQVTIVSLCGRHIHSLYPEATIDPERYAHFSAMLRDYLHTKFDPEVFGNFLRCHPEFQPCFSYRLQLQKRDWYIGAEAAFRYEASSKLKLSDPSRKKLLAQLSEDDCHPSPIPGRLVVNDVESFIRENNLCLEKAADRETLRDHFCAQCEKTCNIIDHLRRFIHVDPQLPDPAAKTFRDAPAIALDTGMDRETITARLEALRGGSLPADLAFHAARLPQDDLAPWWQAALERNPVSLEGLAGKNPAEAAVLLAALPGESIYDGDRLAQPDEVWNFGRGDGFEKAATLVNHILKCGETATLTVAGGTVRVTAGSEVWTFTTAKSLPPVAGTEVYPGLVYTASL